MRKIQICSDKENFLGNEEEGEGRGVEEEKRDVGSVSLNFFYLT